MSYPSDDAGYPATAFPIEPFDSSFVVPARRPRFQEPLWRHILLFVLTLGTTTVAGAAHYASFLSEFSHHSVGMSWSLLLHGFWYSGTILAILGAHEMGHYLFCRRYNVDAIAALLHSDAAADFPDRDPRRGHPDPRGVPDPAGAVRHRHRRPDRRLRRARPGALRRHDALECRRRPDRTASVLVLGEPLLFKIATWLVFGHDAGRPRPSTSTRWCSPPGSACWRRR